MNNQFMLNSLNREKQKIEEKIQNYQSQPSPVNNYINTNQQPNKDLIEWRILNENEEVDNLYVQNKTLFISDNLMILKGVDGSLQKWNIKKFYPIDKKDEKINQLEEKTCAFKMYLKQTMDLLNDSYRWKVIAEECDDEEIKNKYMNVSNTLFDLFMTEHNNIGQMFKGE